MPQNITNTLFMARMRAKQMGLARQQQEAMAREQQQQQAFNQTLQTMRFELDRKMQEEASLLKRQDAEWQRQLQTAQVRGKVDAQTGQEAPPMDPMLAEQYQMGAQMSQAEQMQQQQKRAMGLQDWVAKEQYKDQDIDTQLGRRQKESRIALNEWMMGSKQRAERGKSKADLYKLADDYRALADRIRILWVLQTQRY